MCRPTVDRQSTDRFFGELFFTITLHSALLLVPAGLGNLEEEMIISVDLCGCWVVSSSFQNSTFRFPIHSHSFLSVSKEKPIPNMICLVAKEKRTGRSHYQEYWWFFFKKNNNQYSKLLLHVHCSRHFWRNQSIIPAGFKIISELLYSFSHFSRPKDVIYHL